ncbi:kinetochore complex Sim4 subunit Fta1-domain-containing protein [Xylaria arbuscula]|nr:kinetochore complex Sim4 subunit Fta1-domain-containing protein [Xylaria arbuscula]
MPPKRRGRPAAAEAAQPETVSDHEGEGDADGAAAAASDQGEGSDPDVSHGEAESTSFKFFNTTFSTFRVSPLYTGKNPLTTAGLQTLSRRLRDTLVGDVVRGVQVGLEGDGTLSRLGTLDSVEWREYDPGTLFPTLTDEEETSQQRRNGIRNRKKKGKGKDTGAQTEQVRPILCLELEYEKASFNALLLPSLDNRENQDGNGTQDEDRSQPLWTRHDAKGKATEDRDEDTDSAFARYPLLLTRMPAPLKAVLVDFLSSTFDCRISHLHLGTRTLVRSWERWIEESGAGTGGSKMPDKDVALTLGFHLEPPSPMVLDGTVTGSTAPDGRQGVQETLVKPTVLGLKTMDVVVPSEEIRRFLRVGKRNSPTPTDNGGSTRKRPAASSTISGDERDRLQRRKLGGGKDEEGWTWRQGPRQHQTQDADEDDIRDNDNRITGETFPQPFTDALSHYLDHHLALDMTHPGVRVLRVVCDAFALSDTRLKVFAPRDRGEVRINDGGESDLSRSDSGSGALAIDTFLRSLVRKAQGPEWGQMALKLANLEVLG